jgi:hypothetical protein
MNLSRQVQKRRASTLDADKILRHTHTITHMQHVYFGYAAAADDPSKQAAVYFFEPSTFDESVMSGCMTVYIPEPVSRTIFERIVALLPPQALVITYYPIGAHESKCVLPKAELERAVEIAWDQVGAFFLLMPGSRTANLDEALDTLLDAGQRFFVIAQCFHRALALARPLRISRELQTQYDLFTLLAHRVNTLGPGKYTDEFLESYADDTFVLYDIHRSTIYQPTIDELYRLFAHESPAGTTRRLVARSKRPKRTGVSADAYTSL